MSLLWAEHDGPCLPPAHLEPLFFITKPHAGKGWIKKKTTTTNYSAAETKRADEGSVTPLMLPLSGCTTNAAVRDYRLFFSLSSKERTGLKVRCYSSCYDSKHTTLDECNCLLVRLAF